jgi:histidinol-phosphatase
VIFASGTVTFHTERIHLRLENVDHRTSLEKSHSISVSIRSTPIDVKSYLEFALALARRAGKRLSDSFGNTQFETRLKADGSEVSEIDVSVERDIRSEIERAFPSHGILGEELGLIRPASRLCWVIDPLDGTRWFRLGVPIFGVLISLAKDGEPQLGVIHFPIADETVYAGRNQGCWFVDRFQVRTRCAISEAVTLENAIVSASGVHASKLRPGNWEHLWSLESVMLAAREFQFCGDCLQYALLCRGNVDVAIDTIMKPWDIAAVVPCVEEAGGVVRALDGRHAKILDAPNLIAASNPHLLQQVTRLLNAR